MYLKGLELSGFKSFAKKTSLGFSSPITSIVGPNGSGKSNVAEAFRFVLGEQSIKSLRGKRGEDLIFNGSRTIGRQNRASVKITLDNSKRLLDIDFDEVTIERIVHRDNNNEYLINGSQVRLKDILELLAQAHMGPTGHHIISQGEADRILNANLKERRLMVEDALGLKIYQFKRTESERKLERTRENITQVESLRRELAPHLRFLKKQVEKIEKAKELKKALAELYVEYLSLERAYLREAEQTLSRESEEPTKKLAEREHDLARAKKMLERSKTGDDKSTQVLASEKALRDLRNQKDELLREVGRLEGELSAEDRRLKKLTDENEADTHKTVPLSEVRALAGDIGSRLARVEAVSDVSMFRQFISEMKTVLSGFLKRFESATSTGALEDAVRGIERIKTEKEEVSGRVIAIQEREREEHGKYEALRADIEKEKDEGRDAEREIFRIMAEQNELRAILNSIKGREASLLLEREEYKREEQEAVALVGPETVRRSHEAEVPSVLSDRTTQHERRRNLEKMKIRLEETGSGASEETLKEFEEVSQRDAFLEREVGDLNRSAESLEVLIKDLTARLDIEFKEGVRKINVQFEEFFKLMFGGGSASLEVVRPEKRRSSMADELFATEAGALVPQDEEETEEGIEIRVNLPHKKIRSLEVLSGGERALTSIALLFSISQVNPPPFIILDETDAALDEANSKKYGDMIENLSSYSQLVLITHNRETMSRASVLYGVTMGQDGISKLLSIHFDEAVKVAK